MSRSQARVALALMIAAFAATAGYFSVARHLAFKAHVHDLGLIAQTLDGTLHGRWFQNSINPSIGMPPSYLGNHFSPGLLLFLPLYALFPGPITLLIAQALYLGLAAWPAYLLARQRFSRRLSLLTVAVFLTHTGLWSAAMYDFHHETLSVPLGLTAFWLLARGRTGLALATVALIATFKEHLPLYAAAFAVYAAATTRGRDRRVWLGAAVLFSVYFLLILTKLMPAFSGGHQHSYFEKRYPHLGRNAGEALRTVLTDPGRVIAAMTTPMHVLYYVGLLAPYLFLPLLAPIVLIVGLPTLFINTQSTIPMSYDLGFYHADSLMPPLFAAFLLGTQQFRELFRRITRRLDGSPALACAVLLGPAALLHSLTPSIFLPGYRNPLSPSADRGDYRVTDHHRKIAEVKRRIPATARLCVQANLATFFTDLEHIAPFPQQLEEADHVLLDLTAPYENRTEYRKFWVEYSLQSTIEDYCHLVRGLIHDPRWGVILHQDGYLLLQRGKSAALPADLPDKIDQLCQLYSTFQGRGYGRSRHAATPSGAPSPAAGVTSGPSPGAAVFDIRVPVK